MSQERDVAKDPEETNPGLKNGPVDEEDMEHKIFKEHVRRSALSSLPDVPEEMLPWLVGRFAASEVYQKAFNAEIEAKNNAQTDLIVALRGDVAALRTDIAEVNRKAPSDKLKYSTLAIAATGVLGVVAQHFGVELGPLVKALLAL